MNRNRAKDWLVAALLAAASPLALLCVALYPPMRPAWRLIAHTVYADAPFLFRHVRSLYDLCGILCCLSAMLDRYPRAFDRIVTAREPTQDTSRRTGRNLPGAPRRMTFGARLFRAARIRIEWDLLHGADLPDEPDMLDQMPLASTDPPGARDRLKAAVHGHRAELTFRRMRMYAWMQGDAHLLRSALAIRASLVNSPAPWRTLRLWRTRIEARLRGDGPLLRRAGKRRVKARSAAARDAASSARRNAGPVRAVGSHRRSWRLRLLDWVLERRLRRQLRREAGAFLTLLDHGADETVHALVAAVEERRSAQWTAEAPTAPDAEQPVVELPDCFAITAVTADIKRYFNALAEMALRSDRRKLARPYFRFISMLRIDAGYIAPIHLLGGVLNEFDEDWGPAIRQYGAELSAWSAAQLPTRDLARLQAFAFNCWLSWGPSIPVCTCPQWAGWTDRPIYQFGYGDEGNSFPLVVEDPHERDTLGRAFARTDTHADAAAATAPLALPFSVDANLRWAPAVEVVSPAQHVIARDVDRLVLALSQRRDGGSTAAAGYYSAYVWVMFVLCKASDSLHAATDKPSTSLLPLFEHGNIADYETYVAVKRRLARKAVSTLASLLDTNPGLVVRYACAFDDPNCSDEGGGTTGRSRRKPLCRALADQPLHELLADEIRRRGGLDRLGLDFDDWSQRDIQEFRTLYSACHLPGRVAEYLSELGGAANGEAADAPRSP